MKKCDYCKKEALVTQNNEELCIKHYNLSSDDEEEIKTEKKEVKNDYILL